MIKIKIKKEKFLRDWYKQQKQYVSDLVDLADFYSGQANEITGGKGRLRNI